MVGRRHQRKVVASQNPGRGCQEIPKGIFSTCSSRRSSTDNQQWCEHRNLQRTTINTLWEHYSREELPLKALSTQDAYIMYAKNWIVPRWGNLPFEQVKTVEVERWLRATEVADGTKPRSSALCRLCSRMPFGGSSVATIPSHREYLLEAGGKRGPSTGVRVSAKRQNSPLGPFTQNRSYWVWHKLEFRDQILVFLDGALGIRQGELGALRWLDCDFKI